LEDIEETKTLAIRVITKFELMVGCKDKKELRELKFFLERFEVLHLSEVISSKAVELFNKFRLSHDVKIADMLIASTAITYNIELISKNQKDFKFIDELQLIKYFLK
jgi:predicted nucleic acid-binding protein